MTDSVLMQKLAMKNLQLVCGIEKDNAPNDEMIHLLQDWGLGASALDHSSRLNLMQDQNSNGHNLDALLHVID